jgi:hypothetical protein
VTKSKHEGGGEKAMSKNLMVVSDGHLHTFTGNQQGISCVLCGIAPAEPQAQELLSSREFDGRMKDILTKQDRQDARWLKENAKTKVRAKRP